MAKTIDFMNYKNNKEINNEEHIEENLLSILLDFDNNKKNEEDSYIQKIDWLVSEITKRNRIESNSIYVKEENLKMLFWLSDKLNNYCVNNYIEHIIRAVDNSVFSQGYIVKINNIFINLEVIYDEKNMTLVCTLVEDNDIEDYVDINWIINDIDHPKKIEFRNNAILTEITSIANNYNITLEELKAIL